MSALDPKEVARIIAHVEGYDTPKDTDPRRRYTPAQLDIAIRLAASLAPPKSWKRFDWGVCYHSRVV